MESSSHRSTPSASWRSLYPYRGSELRLAGQRYHYLDSDREYPDSVADGATSRPVILCVHGNPTWSFYWREILRRFHTTHRVIAVDHLGCGFSDKPPRTKADYTLAGHRDRLLMLIDQLDLRQITLLAHDWGGAIGLSAAVRRVDRMAGVVLLNTGAFPPPYVPWRIAACRIPWLGTCAVRGLNLFARAAVSMAMSKTRMMPEVAAGLLAPYGNWHDRVAIDAFVRDIPCSRRHPTYAELERLEADLSLLASLPQLLVWGMRDWCFRPECLERLLLHWPAANVVRLADVGHYVMEDDPEAALTAIASFLGSAPQVRTNS